MLDNIQSKYSRQRRKLNELLYKFFSDSKADEGISFNSFLTMVTSRSLSSTTTPRKISFTTYGIVTELTGGRTASAYIVTLVAMLFTATSYSFMVKRFPVAGSAYSYQHGLRPEQ